MEVGGNHMEVGGNHMRRLHYAYPLVAMIAVLLTLGACSSNSTHAASHTNNVSKPGQALAAPAGTSTVTARPVACSGLATVNKAFGSLLSANVDTTVGDVKAVQQKVTYSLNAIQSKVPSTELGLLDQVKAANDNLSAKIEGYPPTTPIGHTSTKVQDLKTNAASAQAKTTLLSTALKCPPLGTPVATP